MKESPSVPRVLDRVQQAWQLVFDGGAAELLDRGEESVAVRVGHVVVRIGPPWRSSADAEWCYDVADRLGIRCSEVVRPIRTAAGTTTIRVDGCPVSVWPWVEGVPGDPTTHAQRDEAAAVLARLHRAAESIRVGPRPPLSATTQPDPALADESLDDWLKNFTRERRRHALHGDYYPGNLLFQENSLVGILDWDEATVDVPEVELATAACEWGGLLRTGELGAAMEFVQNYTRHGGTASRLDDEEIRQLYRGRLRWELEYELHNTGALESLNEGDRAYRERQVSLYFDLRP